MAEQKSLAYRVGLTIYNHIPDSVDAYCMAHSPRKHEEIERWGREVIEMLRTLGVYVNEARKDPSGRW